MRSDLFERLALASIGSTSGRVDVIFVHGLTGDLTATWTSTNSTHPAGYYWPKWICQAVPDARVFALGYPASLFEKWIAREMSLYERAKATLEYLSSYDFGNRPIAFVAHSLGGLLVKQILRT